MNGAPATLTAIALLLAQQASPPVFKSHVELVRVDALVLDDGRPVAGLRPQDFDVRDNGVRQSVTSLDVVTDVTAGVVLDVSGSMTGERLHLAVEATGALLREMKPDDRCAVVAFGEQVISVADSTMPVDAALARIRLIRPGGSTAMLDALYAGVLQSDRAVGPKLILLLTDGRDNVSWLRARDVIDAARQHETVVYPVAVGVSKLVATAHGRRVNDGVRLLDIIAESTGGRLVEADWNTDLNGHFRRILREFRQRYILAFAPAGVTTGDGWHVLDVKVRRRGAVVRARSRYWAGLGNRVK